MTATAIGEPPMDTSHLIQLAIENSTEAITAQAEVKFQEAVRANTKTIRYTPQLDVYSSEQKYNYDRAYFYNGQHVVNKGTNRIYGATLTFDLQKLFGPELGVASENLQLSRIQNNISQRNVVRVVKKTLALKLQIEAEIRDIVETLKSFQKVEGILKRQSSLGVYTDVEVHQLIEQRGFLEADLITKKTELDSVYFTFSRLINRSIDEVKALLEPTVVFPPLIFATKKELDPKIFSALSDQDMLTSLGRDYYSAKKEASSYSTLQLPALYVKTFHQNPTMPSSQSSGGYGVTEVGVTINLSGFLLRNSQKNELNAKKTKFEMLMNNNIRDYRNSISLTVNQLNQFLKQDEALRKLQGDANKTFAKSFTYYSQKRIDTLTLLDLTQKRLLASQRFHFNKLQINYLDAELEYLVGGARHD
jgi:hypothetical protein